MLFIKSFSRYLTGLSHEKENHAPRFGTVYDEWKFPAGARPGDWTVNYESYRLGMCTFGWHLAPANYQGVRQWGSIAGGRHSIWLAEIPKDAYCVVKRSHQDKFVVSQARLVRRVPSGFTLNEYTCMFKSSGMTKTIEQRLVDGVEWFEHKRSLVIESRNGDYEYRGLITDGARNDTERGRYY